MKEHSEALALEEGWCISIIGSCTGQGISEHMNISQSPVLLGLHSEANYYFLL